MSLPPIPAKRPGMTIWDVLDLLKVHPVLWPAHAPMRLLKRAARLGWCYQSGQLFHVNRREVERLIAA